MTSPVNEGDVLAGKYKVERVLGVGGMGVVVAATHLQLDQKVALKFLLPEMIANAEIVARFEREARAAAKITSEHVARVLDVGKLDSGSPYMVMEYLEGQDLGDVLKERGALPVAEAVGYMLQACEALAEAHAAGIIHRDLKPPNLFLARRADRSKSVKVLDFGISKVTIGADAMKTKTAALMGTPYYMSPEQMTSSKNVDARADVWSLGVILYELLTNETPFYAETMPEIVIKVVQSVPDPISGKQPAVPTQLDAVISKALAKTPNERYANVAEFAEALLPFASSELGSLSYQRISRVLGAPSLAPPKHVIRPEIPATVLSQANPNRVATAATFVTPDPAKATTIEPSRSKRVAAIAIATALACAIAVVALVQARHHAEPEPHANALSEVLTTTPAPSAPAPLASPAIATVVAPPPAPVASIAASTIASSSPASIATHHHDHASSGAAPKKDPVATATAAPTSEPPKASNPMEIKLK